MKAGIAAMTHLEDTGEALAENPHVRRAYLAGIESKQIIDLIQQLHVYPLLGIPHHINLKLLCTKIYPSHVFFVIFETPVRLFDYTQRL